MNSRALKCSSRYLNRFTFYSVSRRLLTNASTFNQIPPFLLHRSVSNLKSNRVYVSTAQDIPVTLGCKGLIVKVKDGIRTIQIDRPEKKNAISLEIGFCLRDSLIEANTDDSTKIIVITGTGDYFTSGNDLENFDGFKDPKKTADKMREFVRSSVAAYIDCKKPIIALVNGSAIGIGVTMLGLVDAVYATEKALFSTPFTSLGQCPEACSSYTFPRIMGFARAGQLLYVNSRITAQQGKEWGLISEVFSDHTFQVEAGKKIQAWAQLPTKALMFTKELIRGGERKHLHQVNSAEMEHLHELLQMEECINVVQKFFSKSKK